MNIDHWVGYIGDNLDVRGIKEWQPSEQIEYNIKLKLWELREKDMLLYNHLAKLFFQYVATRNMEYAMTDKAKQKFIEWYQEREELIAQMIKDNKIYKKYGEILIARKKKEKEKK